MTSPIARLRAIRRSLLRWLNRTRDAGMDRRLGVSTASQVYGQPPDPNARAVRYEPLSYDALRIIAANLPLARDDVVYVVGCGKGRMLCHLARGHAGRCVGIEFDPVLAEAARRNAEALTGRTASVEIRAEDAANSDYGEATVVAMYNPFGAEVMRTVLASLTASLQARPRPLRILYVNPVQAEAFAAFPQLRETGRFRVPYDLSAMDAVLFTAAPG